MVSESEKQFDLIVITSEFEKQHRDFHLAYYNQKIIHQSIIPVLVIHPEAAKLDKAAILIKLEKEINVDLLS